jgi:U5 small nuclear ribonucleoprotein component
MQVRVLGEAYTPDDEEDSAVAGITAVWAYQARYRIPLSKAIAGEFRAATEAVSLCAS